MSHAEFIKFLDTWQTLIGTLLAVFIASMFSLVGFILKDYFDRINARKEARRKIEISVTRSINEIHTVKKNLLSFLGRVDRIIAGAEAVLNNENVYFLEETNLPPMRIYFDENIPNLPTKSYYVHNKVCWVTASLESVNLSLADLKERFNNLSRKNEFLVLNKATKKEQKATYIDNLKDFSGLIKENFIPQALDLGTKTLIEIKVYNQKMRGRLGFFVRWKHEGTSFKYFKNLKEWREYNQELSCIDRIEILTKKDVQKILDSIPSI